jgi:NAD(P)-dependent dehydrogenase (short-subunit alcohol dehydrogenase family)
LKPALVPYRFSRLLALRLIGVNLFGTHGVTQAFLPLLTSTSSRGAIVKNVSMMALAPLPITAACAISKAAAFQLTQSLRDFFWLGRA